MNEGAASNQRKDIVANDDDIVADIDNMDLGINTNDDKQSVEREQIDRNNINIQMSFNLRKYKTYSNIFQWIFTVYCVISVTYLLFRPITANCSCSSLLAQAKQQTSNIHSINPTLNPSISVQPSANPTSNPSIIPTFNPSLNPTANPSSKPSLNPSISPSSNPSLFPTDNPSISPSLNPTSNPSSNPSSKPTVNPSSNPSLFPTANPSSNPSLNPTSNPSLFPTANPSPTDYDRYYVGDYKVSAINESHGKWLLCDGSIYNITNYPSLFGVIGYRFTSNNSNDTLFAVPDSRDKSIGINGIKHLNGEVDGSEFITLTKSNLPSHYHYIANGDWGTSGYDTSHQYLSHYITNDGSLSGYVDHAYILYGTETSPTWFESSSVGNGDAISNMQPTLFIGNAFIYS